MRLSILAITVLLSVLVNEPQPMRVTCYYGGTVTASGTEPREGICAARADWIGKTAVVFDSDMEYVGCFTIEDTGSHPRIQNGSSIDIWQPTLSDCYNWVATYGDYMYVSIVDSEDF